MWRSSPLLSGCRRWHPPARHRRSCRAALGRAHADSPEGGGRFVWHVTPSTRPFVGAKYIEGKKLVRTETFQGAGPTAPAPTKPVEKQFEVTAADMARDLDLKLDWTSKAEDYDLQLSYIEA